MKETKTHSHSTTLKRKAKVVKTFDLTVTHREIGGGFVAYRVSQKLGKGKADKQEGIATLETLDQVLSGELELRDLKKWPAMPARGEATGFLLSVKPAFFDWAQKWGFSTRTDGKKDEGLYDKKRQVHTPLTHLERGWPVEFVEFFTYAGQLFDMEGRPFPVALWCNYIDGRFDNEYFKLKTAVEILLARDDIELFPHGGERRWYGMSEDKSQVEYWIGQIPGYNSEKGRDRCISFRWTPGVEDYRRVFAHAAKLRGERAAKAIAENSPYETYRDPNPSSSDIRSSLMTLDVLGLRPAMKKKCLWRPKKGGS